MSASYQIPGLGTLKRDSAGAWVIEGPGGDSRPLPPEYRLIADELDRWQRLDSLNALASTKATARIPNLWDGPLPGSKSLSFNSFRSMPGGTSSLVFSRQASGNIFIRSISFSFMSGLVSGYPNGDGFCTLEVIHNNSVEFQLKYFDFLHPLDVYLILPPGLVEIRVTNNDSGAQSVMASAVIWERVPPVKR